jgi:hypothetical protein
MRAAAETVGRNESAALRLAQNRVLKGHCLLRSDVEAQAEGWRLKGSYGSYFKTGSRSRSATAATIFS